MQIMDQDLNSKMNKTKLRSKNNKLRLLKTYFASVKLLDEEDPYFFGGVITKYSNTPLHGGACQPGHLTVVQPDSCSQNPVKALHSP